MGYVSTQTRDSTEFADLVEGNILDGLERAKYFGGLRVRLNDTKPYGEIGHIAFSRIDNNTARVQLGRYYQ